MQITVYTDGGARGNPGPAAIGAVIYKNDEVVKELSKKIGETTNNIAEYTAVVEALYEVKQMVTSNNSTHDINISFFLDSLLVVNQLNGLYKVKHPALREYLQKIRTLEQEVRGVIRYSAIPREKNRRADFLVNKALDNRL